MTPVEVLMVEDNRGDVVLVQAAIEKAGLPYQLTVVSDGAEAVEFLHRRGKYAASTRPELITLDLKLPCKNGCEVLEDIRLRPGVGGDTAGPAEQFQVGTAACPILRAAGGMLSREALHLSRLCRAGVGHRSLSV